MGCAIPGQVGLGYVNKGPEQAKGIKPVSSVPLLVSAKQTLSSPKLPFVHILSR